MFTAWAIDCANEQANSPTVKPESEAICNIFHITHPTRVFGQQFGCPGLYSAVRNHENFLKKKKNNWYPDMKKIKMDPRWSVTPDLGRLIYIYIYIYSTASIYNTYWGPFRYIKEYESLSSEKRPSIIATFTTTTSSNSSGAFPLCGSRTRARAAYDCCCYKAQFYAARQFCSCHCHSYHSCW